LDIVNLMRSFYIIIIIIIIVFLSSTLSSTRIQKSLYLIPLKTTQSLSDEIDNFKSIQKMKITIGTTSFIANLLDNPTTQTFKKLLPLTLDMSDLNDNEKYFYLSTILPTKSSVGGNIRAGDIMLYGNNCLVLFYEGLHTIYSYTKLGHIDDISGLIEAIGTGNVIIKFEIM
jgi:hypothetical protein